MQATASPRRRLEEKVSKIASSNSCTKRIKIGVYGNNILKGNKQPLVDYIKNEGYKARDRFVKHKFASFFDSSALVLQIQSHFNADSDSKPPWTFPSFALLTSLFLISQVPRYFSIFAINLKPGSNRFELRFGAL